MSQDYWWLSHNLTKKNIACRKNGWEGTLPDVTKGSEFNNNKDLKKALDTEAETNKERDHTYMPWIPDIPENCNVAPIPD